MDKYFKNIINAEELSELDMESIKGGWKCQEFSCGKYSGCETFACVIFMDTGIDIKPDKP